MKTITLLSFIFSITQIYSTPETKEKCYVLALEGGGDKGAYQAGALKGLVDTIPKNESQWDVVTGVSVGALDASAIAIYPVGEETKAIDFLLETWRTIKGNKDIFQNWWLGPLGGLFWDTGLYDTTPLKNKLTGIVKGNTLKRKFVCGATNFHTGAFETWDEEDLTGPEYVDAILSSASYPVVFPITTFRKESYMDGGVKVSVDITSGINKCLDMNYTQENIVIDVVLLSNTKNLPEEDAKTVHPLGVLMRVFEIYGYDNSMRDFEYAKKAFPRVNFRYVVSPTKKLPSGSIPLTFSPKQIETMIQIGIQDAKDVIAKGEGKNLEDLLNNYSNERVQRFSRKSKKGKKVRKENNNENVNIVKSNEKEVEDITFLE